MVTTTYLIRRRNNGCDRGKRSRACTLVNCLYRAPRVHAMRLRVRVPFIIITIIIVVDYRLDRTNTERLTRRDRTLGIRCFKSYIVCVCAHRDLIASRMNGFIRFSFRAQQ